MSMMSMDSYSAREESGQKVAAVPSADPLYNRAVLLLSQAT